MAGKPPAEFAEVCERENGFVAKANAEDEEMLIRLMKIRLRLWT